MSYRLHIPFTIDIDPMERLLLINFEKDPDSLYVGFEPQVFDDEINGKGHIVIGWRVDGKIDVYYQHGLNLDRGKYDIAGKGLENMVETVMEKGEFYVSANGVNASYEFKDIENRTVSIAITEKNKKKRKPFGLLAPMGSVAENPSALPLVLLHDFYFVRKKQTDITISIAGKKHKPDELPIPMDFTKMLFTRYSPDPLIVTFSREVDDILPCLEIEKGANKITEKDVCFNIEWVSDKPRIKSIHKKSQKHTVKLSFSPSFPEIGDMEESGIEGDFEIEGEVSTGKIKGKYNAQKKGKNITLIVIPSKGWIPRPDKLSLRFLYTVAKIFKTWPATYKWTANIAPKENGQLGIKSTWERIKN
jgi:hypothetical protein